MLNRAKRRSAAAHAPFALALLACTAIALWLVWPAFEPGRILNMDAPRHLLRSMVMAREFLPSGHVDGWSPWWYLGAQLFLFQSYGYFLLIGLSAIAVQRLVELETVFKLFYVLPIVALPATLAFLALRLGVSRRGAIAAAAASLVFASSFGYGMRGVFGIGLLLQGAGVLGFGLAWTFVLDALWDYKHSLWTPALLLAGVLLLHFITGAYALAATGLLAVGLALVRRDVRPLLRYAALASIVLLLAGHSLFPSLEWREIGGVGVGWGQNKDRFHSFLAGTLFGARPWALLAIAAAVLCVMRRRDRLDATAAVFLCTALIGGMNIQPWEPGWLTRSLGILVRPRMLPYAAMFQALFFGVAFDGLWRMSRAIGAHFGRRGVARVAALALTAALGVVGYRELREYRELVRTETMLSGEQRDPYLALVSWLRRYVAAPAVIAAPRDFFTLPVIASHSVTSLLNMDTGLYALGGDQAELTRAGSRMRHIDLRRSPAQAAKVLRVLGVSVVITTSPKIRRRLANDPGFRRVFDYGEGSRSASSGRNGRITVFRVRKSGLRLLVPGIATLRPESSPEHLSWDVQVRPRPGGAQALAAINWHPNWKAFVDGQQVPITRTRFWTLRFPLARNARRVSLEFRRSPRERLYNVVSGTTLVLVVCMQVLRVRRRQRDANAGTPAASQ